MDPDTVLALRARDKFHWEIERLYHRNSRPADHIPARGSADCCWGSLLLFYGWAQPIRCPGGHGSKHLCRDYFAEVLGSSEDPHRRAAEEQGSLMKQPPLYLR